MSELIAWLIVLGLAVTLVGIYLLSKQIQEHRRDTAEIMLQSNELMLEQLKRLSDPADTANPVLSMTLERRSTDRRRHTATVIPWPSERRKSPGRRTHDLKQAQA